MQKARREADAERATAGPSSTAEEPPMPARMQRALAAAEAAEAAAGGALPPGKAMLRSRCWAVIGDVHSPVKPARAVAEKLERAGKVVHRVNPRDPKCHKDLRSIATSTPDVDWSSLVINLIINSYDGLPLIRQAADLGVRQVYIQPGAGSAEIEAFCKAQAMVVYHGCVLIEL